jgi:hypothetical protein
VKFKNASGAKLNADHSRDGIGIAVIRSLRLRSGQQQQQQRFHGLSTQKAVRRPGVNNKEDVAIEKGRPGARRVIVISAALTTTGYIDDKSRVPVKNLPSHPRLVRKC